MAWHGRRAYFGGKERGVSGLDFVSFFVKILLSVSLCLSVSSSRPATCAVLLGERFSRSAPVFVFLSFPFLSFFLSLLISRVKEERGLGARFLLYPNSIELCMFYITIDLGVYIYMCSYGKRGGDLLTDVSRNVSVQALVAFLP